MRAASVPRPSSLEGATDLVTDLDDRVIISGVVDDDEEEMVQKATLCTPPPCGVRADAVPQTKLPVSI